MDDEVSNNNKRGFKVKIKKNSSAHSWKLPIYCPREECRMITSNLDDEILRSHGICLACYVQLVENREKPLIDVEFYRKRLQERGY